MHRREINRFRVPLKFKRIVNGGLALVCITPGCNATATREGRCHQHSHNWRASSPYMVRLGSVRWANPVYLERQRKWLAPRLRALSALTNEKEGVRALYNRLDTIINYRLDQLEKEHGENGGVPLDKEMRDVALLVIRAATAVAKIGEIDSRAHRLLGHQMTAERLSAFQTNLANLLLAAITGDVIPAVETKVSIAIHAHIKNLAPGVDADAFAAIIAKAACRPIVSYRSHIKAVFLSGRLLDEATKEMIRPSLGMGDQIIEPERGEKAVD